MKSVQTLPADKPRTKVAHPRFFYSGAAALLFLLMFVGFQFFYLHGKAYPGRELTPPIRILLIAHGVAMSAWMVLFLAQPLLIATRNRRVHMALGRVGAGLAAVIVVLGFRVAIGAASVNPPEMKLWNLTPKQFLAVPLVSIAIFALLVAMAVWKRRQPEAHRPLMLLATLAIIPAAMDRIGFLHNLYTGTIWGTLFGPFFSALVVGLLLVCLNGVMTRSLNRWLAIGYAGLVVASALVMQVAPTHAWESFADLLVH